MVQSSCGRPMTCASMSLSTTYSSPPPGSPLWFYAARCLYVPLGLTLDLTRTLLLATKKLAKAAEGRGWRLDTVLSCAPFRAKSQST